jgi:hypothetical protein
MAQSVLSIYAELLSMDRTSSSKHLSAGLIRPADVIYNAVENGIVLGQVCRSVHGVLFRVSKYKNIL